MIVFLIRFIYSLSVRRCVLSFQKPGPLGFVAVLMRTVIIEWSVQ